jgi:hypothetical protein
MKLYPECQFLFPAGAKRRHVLSILQLFPNMLTLCEIFSPSPGFDGRLRIAGLGLPSTAGERQAKWRASGFGQNIHITVVESRRDDRQF